ncbi:MAG: aminotransferase class IV [Sphingobacteriaceae bacterium]|nr:aminotransferase class IV [Sphingobacteriaceae bacterium]
MELMLLDGEGIKAQEMGDLAQNRSFLYGDGVFESIRVMYGQALWPSFHFERLQYGLKQLGIHYHQTQLQFEQRLQKLIELNKIHGGARLRVHVWRRAGGLYRPENDGGMQLMQITALEPNEFVLNAKGLQLGDSKIIKQALFQPDVKTTNALQYVLAAREAKAANWDDAFLYHSEGGLLESSSSNVFILKQGVLLTPRLEDGCLPGILRRVMMEKLPALGYKIKEQLLAHNDLQTADEVYLTNAISGLRWVGGWRTKRYFKKQASILVDDLNQLALQSLTQA